MITLTTDFGLADGYVGVMKGVLLSIAPTAQLVDLTHELPAQDVRRAAFVLCAAAPFFPPGTVHLAVVDPGVGTSRRALALRAAGALWVGPDNGLFSYVLAESDAWEAVELSKPAYRLTPMSNTFHGRDLFAPAAAHLAMGVPLAAFGPPVVDPVLLPLPGLAVEASGLEGEVLHADRFGNLVTSIGRLSWEGEALRLRPAFRRGAADCSFCAASACVEVAGQKLHGIHRTYSAVASGKALALVGSSGFLEIAVRQGSAEQSLSARPGERVWVGV